MASLRVDDQDLDAMLESLGALYTHGVDVDWRRIEPARRRWVALPTYPWQRQRCWIDPPKPGRNGNGAPRLALRVESQQAESLVVAPDEEDSGASDASALTEPPCADGNLVETLWLARPENRRALLENYLRHQIAQTLATDPDRIDVQQSLTTLGIDSLMAIETKNRVEAELGVEVHLVQFLEGPTVARLADALLPQLDRCASSPECERNEERDDEGAQKRNEFRFTGGGEVEDEEAQRLLERVDQLSDEEIDALMHRMLAE